MNKGVHPGERASRANKDCFLNTIKTQCYSSYQVKEVTCFKVLVLKTFWQSPLQGNISLFWEYNTDALWQKPDFKQLQTPLLSYTEKVKGAETLPPARVTEITKEHIKAAADLPFPEHFVRSRKRLQVFLSYLRCKNKLLISDKEAKVCWGS